MATPTKRSSPNSIEYTGTKRIRSQVSPQQGLDGNWKPNGNGDGARSQPCQARTGLQRSIAMVLQRVGFQTANPAAMESFANVVEAYLDSICVNVKATALAARRDHPTPADFSKTLRRFNIPISSLKPHRRHPLTKEIASPDYIDNPPLDLGGFTTLPLLSEELSGKADKDRKLHIPASFPDFPSRHTYSFTAQENTNIRDPKKTREVAARTAQQGEDALRRLVRASKMRKQKEVKSLVEKDEQGKERFRLWESTMRHFLGTDAREEIVDQSEATDHSMIVNSDTQFSRKEVPRLHKRTPMQKA